MLSTISPPLTVADTGFNERGVRGGRRKQRGRVREENVPPRARSAEFFGDKEYDKCMDNKILYKSSNVKVHV